MNLILLPIVVFLLQVVFDSFPLTLLAVWCWFAWGNRKGSCKVLHSTTPTESAEEIVALEQAVQQTLRTDARPPFKLLHSDQVVFALPQISTVFAHRDVSAKRLAVPFLDQEELETYSKALASYTKVLKEVLGVDCVLTGVVGCHVDGPQPGLAVWLTQPLLSPLTAELPGLPEAEALRLYAQVMGHVLRMDGRIGLNARLSNWCRAGTGLALLDVSTPYERKLRDQAEHVFDFSYLITASFPTPIRELLNYLVVADIAKKFYDPRATLLDCLANLDKELSPLIGAFLDLTNRELEQRQMLAISRKEIEATAKEVRQLSETLAWLRRTQRALVRRGLFGFYPYLLPQPQI